MQTATARRNSLINRTPRTHALTPVAQSVALLCLGVLAAIPETSHAQTASAPVSAISPLGFTGSINTPVAMAVPYGSMVTAWTNSNPEYTQKTPARHPFGSLNMGFGIHPGLELIGRLAYDGAIKCNMYAPDCPSTMRDLSISGKYVLPFTLPFQTRIAGGFTDYGGAATSFRQYYGVSTSRVGPLNLSLGYSHKSSTTALMDGAFGSVSTRLSEHWGAMAEYDTRASRAGFQYNRPLSSTVDMQLGYSHTLTGNTPAQGSQWNASLRVQLDSPSSSPKPYAPTATWSADPDANKARMQSVASVNTDPVTATGVITPAQRANPMDGSAHEASVSTAPSAIPSNANKSAATTAELVHKVAARLRAKGFSDIRISTLESKNGSAPMWWIRAEPTLWRQSHLQAIGVGLGPWLEAAADNAEIVFTLTYMGLPTTSIQASKSCLNSFSAGQDSCMGRLPLQMYNLGHLPPRLNSPTETMTEWDIPTHSSTWKPQIEMGLGLKTTVGTEYGLVDYSTALNLGGQMKIRAPILGEGWFWQGNAFIPAFQSRNFSNGGIFHSLGFNKAVLDQAYLTHMRYLDLPGQQRVAVQASAGAYNSYTHGGQVDSVWMNANGFWRVGGTIGAYRKNSYTVPGLSDVENPLLLSVRRTIWPGHWQVEGTAGKFLGGDSGVKLSSQHWMGDSRLNFYLTRTNGGTTLMPQRTFMGFEISFPLGTGLAKDFDALSVRSQDRFTWGLKTKIKEVDNYLTVGYAEAPRPTHGIWTDLTDYDRAGRADLWGDRNKLRNSLGQ